MKTSNSARTIPFAITAFSAGAFAFWVFDRAILLPGSIEGPRAIAAHWRKVEHYRRFLRDPSNFRPDPQNPGLHVAQSPPDPGPSLAALVAARELEHVDLVFPNVAKHREANRLWMTWTDNHDDILYAVGNPSYTDYQPSGEQPLRLQLWFRKRAKSSVQELIHNLEELTPQSTSRSTATATAEQRTIADLIEKLAIEQEPAENRPVYSPSIDTPADDPRVIAFDAAEKLTALGKVAYPQLLEHLDDERQSVAFRRVDRHTVGLACFCIIEDQIFALPDDYRGSFYRTGTDGQSHPRPRFLNPGVFDRATVADWLKARESKSLPEMQLEALDWLIAEEEKIGFPSEKEREQYLYPLQRQRAKIAASAESSP